MPLEGGVEMTWKVFGGDQADVLAALVFERAFLDGLEEQECVAECFKAHLHRGLGYLASETGPLGVAKFVERWLLNKRSGE